MADQTAPVHGNIFEDMANYVTSTVSSSVSQLGASAFKAAVQPLVGRVLDRGMASDVVQGGGITAAVSLMKAFPGLQSMNTPEGLLNTLETKLLPNLPESVPAGVVYNLLDHQSLPDEAKAKMRAALDPKLKDDGKLSRSEMLEVMADLGNSTSPVEPAAAIRQQAAGVLEREHIDDPTGKIATGLAKLAVSGAIGVQRIEDGSSPAGVSLLIDKSQAVRSVQPGPAPGPL